MVKFKLNGKEIKTVKGMSVPELNALRQKLGHDIKHDNDQRQRPRNPTEWKFLKKWEYERGGIKIGEIGPAPSGLEDFDPATWDPDLDEDIINESKKFENALNEGMSKYDDALNELKDR